MDPDLLKLNTEPPAQPDLTPDEVERILRVRADADLVEAMRLNREEPEALFGIPLEHDEREPCEPEPKSFRARSF